MRSNYIWTSFKSNGIYQSIYQSPEVKDLPGQTSRSQWAPRKDSVLEAERKQHFVNFVLNVLRRIESS